MPKKEPSPRPHLLLLLNDVNINFRKRPAIPIQLVQGTVPALECPSQPTFSPPPSHKWWRNWPHSLNYSGEKQAYNGTSTSGLQHLGREGREHLMLFVYFNNFHLPHQPLQNHGGRFFWDYFPPTLAKFPWQLRLWKDYAGGREQLQRAHGWSGARWRGDVGDDQAKPESGVKHIISVELLCSHKSPALLEFHWRLSSSNLPWPLVSQILVYR